MHEEERKEREAGKCYENDAAAVEMKGDDCAASSLRAFHTCCLTNKHGIATTSHANLVGFWLSAGGYLDMEQGHWLLQELNLHYEMQTQVHFH